MVKNKSHNYSSLKKKDYGLIASTNLPGAHGTTLSKAASSGYHARLTALSLLDRLEELAHLKRKINGEHGPTKEQVKEGRLLVEKISNLKIAISDLGYEPQQAVSWATEAREEYLRLRKEKPKSKSLNGVGIYRLGPTLKNWR